MVAVISSTIKPDDNDKSKSFYPYPERLQQTMLTLTGLQDCGFNSIYLVDNSPMLDQLKLQQLFYEFPHVKICHLQQYQFNNKGINELLMLLFIINQLPANQNIFKISGRYYPTSLFKKPDFKDFAVKEYNFKHKTGTVSTRGYWVKDAQALEHFLFNCLNEVFSYSERIKGFRSLYKILRQLFLNKSAKPLNISIEFAAANVLKRNDYQITLLPDIGIEGLIAGANHMEKIIE